MSADRSDDSGPVTVWNLAWSADPSAVGDVLDAGDYSRLGESRTRRSVFRLVGATNRPLTDLRPDVLARFPLRITLPRLDDRREDIPFLVQHLAGLLRRTYALDVRELAQLVWASMAESPGDVLDPPRGLFESSLDAIDWEQWKGADPETIPVEALRACLDACNGVQEQVWQALGLSSRHVLTVSRSHRD